MEIELGTLYLFQGFSVAGFRSKRRGQELNPLPYGCAYASDNATLRKSLPYV